MDAEEVTGEETSFAEAWHQVPTADTGSDEETDFPSYTPHLVFGAEEEVPDGSEDIPEEPEASEEGTSDQSDDEE